MSDMPRSSEKSSEEVAGIFESKMADGDSF